MFLIHSLFHIIPGILLRLRESLQLGISNSKNLPVKYGKNQLKYVHLRAAVV